MAGELLCLLGCRARCQGVCVLVLVGLVVRKPEESLAVLLQMGAVWLEGKRTKLGCLHFFFSDDFKHHACVCD